MSRPRRPRARSCSATPTSQINRRTLPRQPQRLAWAVAGLCDPSGRIFGLMPHPERHVDPLHHPRWTRLGPKLEGDGMRIFRNAVAAVRGG